MKQGSPMSLRLRIVTRLRLSTALPGGAAARELRGEWVGQMRCSGESRFIRMQIVDPGWGRAVSAAMDLPGELRFRQELTDFRLAAGRVTFTLQGERRNLRFAGELREERLSGRVEAPEGSGSFELARVVGLSAQAYDLCRGPYELSPERILFFGQRKIADLPAYFYCDGAALVRLYPLSSVRFLSERGEDLSFVHRPAGPSELRLQAPSAEPVTASRSSLYEEEVIHFRNGDLTLTGELFLPRAPGPHPAVILQHGGNTPERHFCQVYASLFARHGLAALTFDRRGYKSLLAELPVLASDVRAAFDFLRSDPRIDRRRIGLWGLSCGAWVVPLAASQLPDLAFLVVISGIVHTPAEQETFRRKNELRESGIPDDVVESVGRAWEILYEYGITHHWKKEWTGELRSIRQSIRREPKLRDLRLPPGRSPWQQPVPPTLSIPTLRRRIGGAFQEMGYDSLAPYRKITCPILYMLGEKDSYLPIEESFQRVERAVREAGGPRPELRVVPGAGHCMNVVRRTVGGPQNNLIGLRLHAYDFPPDYLTAMTDWMSAQAKPAGLGTEEREPAASPLER